MMMVLPHASSQRHRLQFHLQEKYVRIARAKSKPSKKLGGYRQTRKMLIVASSTMTTSDVATVARDIKSFRPFAFNRRHPATRKPLTRAQLHGTVSAVAQ